MARLKLGLHPPRMPARPLGELLILHLTLLDPAARPDAPPLPSVPERVPADSVGCDGAQHPASPAPMVPRAHSWPHWLPRLATEAGERLSPGVAAEAARHLLLHGEHAQVALRLI